MTSRTERPVVMIVASHPILRNAIYESLLLMQPGWEHIEAPGAEQALALVAARKIDIALVDASLAVEGCTQTVPALGSAAPGMQIVVLTDTDDLVTRAAHETAGACAFARKRSLFTELEALLPVLLAARGSP